MAKITVAGSAVVVTSSVKKEDWDKVNKYRPSATILTEGEEKTPVFAVEVGESGSGSINKYGIKFDSQTAEGYACLTLVTTVTADKVKEHVADTIGGAFNNLEKLEATIPAVIEEINAERATLLGKITVA